MGVVIDTGVLIWLERRRQPLDALKGTGQPLFMSAVTVSELLVGLELANSVERRRRREGYIVRSRSVIAVLDFTASTAAFHSTISARLRTGGTMIGAHDLIIAATTVENGHSLFTTNRREFERVEGLRVIEFPLN